MEGYHSSQQFPRSTSQLSSARTSSMIRTTEGPTQIIGERTMEKTIRVPRVVTTEEIVEKVVVVPEKRLCENVVEDTVVVREKVVEVAKPVIKEKIVELNEVEYFETNVEFPNLVHEERIKEVARVSLEEEIVEVPKIIKVEKIVEVPEIEYREIPVEKIVEVVEYEDEIVTRQVPVDEYVEVLVHQDKLVNVEKEFARQIPVPVELVSEWKFQMPTLEAVRRVVPLEVRIPRFIEVPVPSAFLSESEYVEAVELWQSFKNFVGRTLELRSLCVMEELVASAVQKKTLVRNNDEATTTDEISSKLKRHIDDLGPMAREALPPGVRHMESII